MYKTVKTKLKLLAKLHLRSSKLHLLSQDISNVAQYSRILFCCGRFERRPRRALTQKWIRKLPDNLMRGGEGRPGAEANLILFEFCGRRGGGPHALNSMPNKIDVLLE